MSNDGIHQLLPRELQSPVARKYRDIYACRPCSPFVQKTFGLWMCLDTWYEDGLPREVPVEEFFHFDPPGQFILGYLGWTDPHFFPEFKIEILEDRGDTEVVRDKAGRSVLCFKGKRHGFMPEFLEHPVKDFKTWEENVKWRLNADTPGRDAPFAEMLREGRQAAAEGQMMTLRMIGGYMYLRSLIGPEELFYMLYDQPELIHDCMKTWLELADRISARYQQELTIDEVFFAEDICYNNGPLIGPDMMQEFLFPYYQQLFANIRSRQLDPNRHLYIQLDTDGDCRPVIDLYRDHAGVDVMSPFEVASGCDVIEIGRRYPDLVIQGGFDKRILARGQDAIDREVERIFPVMHARGGYIPTCDHGVPPEVNWRDYLHFRKRCLEYN